MLVIETKVAIVDIAISLFWSLNSFYFWFLLYIRCEDD